MGKKKLHNPFQIGKPANPVVMESAIALREYQARMTARQELARNEEILKMTDERDAWQENWMWGLFAVVLHRRYHFEADEIVRIMNDVQSLHNEIYDGTLSYEDTNQIVLDLARKEVGLDIESEDLKEVKHRCG